MSLCPHLGTAIAFNSFILKFAFESIKKTCSSYTQTCQEKLLYRVMIYMRDDERCWIGFHFVGPTMLDSFERGLIRNLHISRLHIMESSRCYVLQRI